MKKLIWSAFAMSLIIMPHVGHSQTESVDDFLGLESEILPDLKGEQRFTTPELHEKESWKVYPDKVEVDLPAPNKGQGYSIIPWSTLDPEDFLSINTWLIERKIKDETPDWKIRLRQAEHKELVGKVLQCKGTCEVYRGSNKANVQHLSRITEGDEIKTAKDSVAWIYLMDGSLMRLSPETSVSINEFNLTKSDFFILARLNQGHIFFHPRTVKDLPLDLAPETDSVSLPLLVRDANQQFYERGVYGFQNDEQRVSEVLNLDETAVKNQVAVLNSYKADNNPIMNFKSRVMIVTPNSTLVTKDVSFDYVYLPGGKGYFKKRTGEEGDEFSLHLRGYAMTQAFTVGDMTWHEVDQNGRNYNPLTDVPGTLQVLELITKRIKSIELARELWVRDFTLPIMKSKSDANLLAKDFGYTLWGDEMSRRFDFLVEYTRRIETTNLRSLENLLVKLEKSGETIRRELSDEQYQVSLNHYLLGLKTRYDKKKMRVRDMNDLQYYVWILKNGKF
jgi:hypothetical protein